jgi:ribosomal-protein-alanine N-acetyltransferase
VIDFPILTAHLLIRPTILDDAAGLHATWGDAEVMRYLGPPLADIEQTRELLRAKIAQQVRDGFSLWTVTERETGAIAGTCGLQHEDGPEVGLGFLLARSFWGRGYGREAAAATFAAGLDQLDLERIIGITEFANRPARRLMEAIGMRDEGSGKYYGRDWALFVAERGPATR